MSLEMSEYQYLDVIVSMRDSIGFHAMNFIAILFAYLIAGYFAAHLLSRFQAIALTIFYLILAPMPGLAAQEAITDYVRVVSEYRAAFTPSEPVSLYIHYGPEAWGVGVIGSIVLSIVFMLQSRAAGEKTRNAI